MRKKILIIGNTGFIGKNLFKKLKKNKKNLIYLINSSNCNLLEKKNIFKLKEKFDLIFHLAAFIKSGKNSKKEQKKIYYNNLKINNNVFNWWIKTNIKAKFISIGTSASYSKENLTNEKYYLYGKKLQTDWKNYVYTKRKLQILLNQISKKQKVSFLTIVPSTVYGPGYNLLKKNKHFIIDLIFKILIGKIKKQKVYLYGTGNEKRDIIFIDDFVKLSLLAVKKLNNTIINLSTGKQFSIKYYAKLICKKLNFKFKNVVFKKNLHYGSRNRNLDISSLKKLSPNYSFISMNEGIEKTIKWTIKQSKKNEMPIV